MEMPLDGLPNVVIERFLGFFHLAVDGEFLTQFVRLLSRTAASRDMTESVFASAE